MHNKINMLTKNVRQKRQDESLNHWLEGLF